MGQTLCKESHSFLATSAYTFVQNAVVPPTATTEEG